MTSNEWLVELEGVFKGLRSGTIDRAIAAEMNNSAGKAIQIVKLELECAKLCTDVGKKMKRLPSFLTA